MSDRVVGRAIGALFLAAFLCYGVGSLLVESVGASDQIVRSAQDHPYRLSGGALLMLANSVVVAAIGVLAHRHLRPTRPTAAVVYLATRVFEAVLLAVGVVFALLLIPLSDQAVADGDALAAVVYAGNDIAFQVAMIGLGLGSVWFCWALYKDQLVHRTLALWGLVAYPIFGVGAMLEILGYGVGVLFAIPGGLFEVVLGITLLVRGLPQSGGRLG